MKIKLLSAVLFAAVASTTGSALANAQHLTGAGATFPNPIYSKWFSEFSASHPGVEINYQSVGSGAGIRQVSEKTVDFGASDGPMTDEQLRAAKSKIIHIPTVLGAVVPIYNIASIKTPLKFAPDVIADIYLGKINKWNDPRIAKDNPGVSLPDHQILPVYRSDGSGTTYIFTDFLSKVSPEFETKIGKATSVKWPLGIGAKGSEGVAGIVRSSPYSFGYVELIYAAQNKIEYGQVRNAAGKWVTASVAGVTAAAANAKAMPADYRASITNAPGAESYPISSFTWLLIPAKSDDPAKGKVLVEFLNWMLDKGESEAGALDYAPLPKAVADNVRKTIKTIQ